MRLNQADIIDQGGPPAIKAWLGAMNLEAKTEPRPVFQLMGPLEFPVRMRAKGVASRTEQWTFKGTEKLAISSIYGDTDHTSDSMVIKVTFVPAPTELKLLKDGFASMNMPLESAMDRLEGLAEWVNKHSAAVPQMLAREAKGQVFDQPVISKEELQSSEEWGAW